MTAVQTSIDTYHALRDAGDLGRCQREVLAVFQPGRDYSLQELVRLLGWPVNRITGRVFELREMGRLELAPKRPCPITGRIVAPIRLPLEVMPCAS